MENKVKSIFKSFCEKLQKGLMFFSVFCLTVASLSAQVTIGTGTSSLAYPFSAWYGYTRSASIYTAAEVTTNGTITHLGWYVGTAQSTSIPIKIYVKETASATLTADNWTNLTNGATLVYDASVSFNSTGWKTIDINDFSYSTNNLLILCEANYGGGGTGTYPQFRYTAATNKHLFIAQDNTAPTGTGTVNNNRPNIQITITNCTIVGGSASPASGTVNAGETTTITSTGHTSSGTLLQWEQSADGTTSWANVTGGSGETTSVYTTPALTSTVYYRLKVADSGNPTCVKYSTVSCVNVVCPLSGGTVLATDDEIFKGQTAELTCSGYTSSGTTLQWQWSADGLTNWADVSDGSGATTSVYTSGILTANTYFRLKVIGASCTTYSTVEQVNVICRVTSGGTAIATDTNILMGETVTVSVSDYSAGAIYFQWQQSANGTSGWEDVAGGTGAYTDTYNTPELFIKTYYRLLVSDDYCAAYSSVVEIQTTLSNDECLGSVMLNVNDACNYQTFNNTGATESDPSLTAGCGGTIKKDIWFKLVVPESGHIEINTQAGTLTDVAMALYSGTCASLALIECDDDDGDGTMSLINRPGLTPGDTLFLRLWDYNGNDFGTFGICISVPAPIAPDECVNATELTVSPVCEYYVFNYMGSTASSGLTNPTCGTSNYYNDVWFKFEVPVSGNVRISAEEILGSTVVDAAIAVYSGSCASLTQVTCQDNYVAGMFRMPMIDLYDRTPGEILYIRFWDIVTSGKSTAYDQGTCKICVYELPDLLDCIASVSPEDLCADAPTIMSLDGYCGNTSATYNPEEPGNLISLFCGSIENNSWLSFVASEESAQLNVYVSDCYSTTHSWSYPTNGIQMQVYGTADCGTFSAYSDCWFPGVPVDGFITARGLTPGNQYYLMIDGVYGDNCDYKIGAAEGSVILPVSFISNKANCAGDRVEIMWTTGSEKNCESYSIEKSFDAINYFMIGQIPGSGTTYIRKNYSFDDYDLSDDPVYYRIKQTDYDGTSMYSDIFTANCFEYKHLGISVYPNPFQTSFCVKFNDTNLMPEKLEITSLTGDVIIRRIVENTDSDEICIEANDEIIPGYYLLKTYFGENVIVLKLIKI